MSSAESTPKTASHAPTRRPPMRGINKFLLIITCLVTMAFLRTGFVFIVVGLLPSIIAYFMDRSRHRHIFKCIFSCNLAALIPSIGKLIVAGPSSFLINELMGDTLNWMFIYGAALMGLLLVNIMSSLAQIIVSKFHKNHVIQLNNNQKKIEQEWGHEVTQFSHPDAPEA
jgi:hypothetical protein